MRRLRAAILVAAIAASYATVPASAAVDPPPGSPRFLSPPYSDPSISILHSWYYKGYSGDQSFCDYPYDLPDAHHHCSIDYVKRVRWRFQSFPVLASADGVARRQTCSGCGTYIQVEHDVPTTSGATSKWCTRYLHLNPAFPIATGPVRRGQQIATAGRTGTDVIHLHWDVRPGTCSRWRENQVDPFDIAGPLLRQGIAPTKEWYPGGSKFAGCGPNALMAVGC